MIAVARVTADHDEREKGGTAPDPLVWEKDAQDGYAGLM